jgi:Uma2 family endonuclease
VLSFGAGIDLGQRKTCYIPDTLVTTEAALSRDDQVFAAADILLVVEVLSPSNKRVDLVLKRHDYGAAGIPQYWIVDLQGRTLTVLSDPYADGYRLEATVKAGEQWTATDPFPVTLDPAEFT